MKYGRYFRPLSLQFIAFVYTVVSGFSCGLSIDNIPKLGVSLHRRVERWLQKEIRICGGHVQKGVQQDLKRDNAVCIKSNHKTSHEEAPRCTVQECKVCINISLY